MRTIKAAFIAISITFLSCGENNHKQSDSQQFKTLTVKTEDVTLTNTYSASIRGRQDIKIIPRVSGYLTDISVKEGQSVREGQTLFILDQVAFKSALQAAKANVAICEANVSTAELTYDSKKALYDKKIVSNYDLEFAQNSLRTANAQLQQAKAQEDAAKNDLSFTVIKSPSNGVVGKIPYRKGDYVSPSIQDGLTVVADNSQMYVYFSMVERQIMEMVHKHKNIDTAIAKMPVIKLLLSDESTYEHSGKIESISGVLDAATGAASIRAVFPNEGGLLLSGGAGSVIVPYNSTDVIVIPQEATYEIQDKTYVYRVVNGVAVSTIVTVDKINNGTQYIVTDGLNANDVIIAEGAGLVREGTKISTQENKE